MTYDVGVGGDDHEGVEGEDGDCAQGEGTAGNLRRRHHCRWKRAIQFQPGELKQIIRMSKIELLKEARRRRRCVHARGRNSGCALPVPRAPGAASSGSKGRGQEHADDGRNWAPGARGTRASGRGRGASASVSGRLLLTCGKAEAEQINRLHSTARGVYRIVANSRRCWGRRPTRVLAESARADGDAQGAMSRGEGSRRGGGQVGEVTSCHSSRAQVDFPLY
jgi:hypothetical protein